ncbi:MAG: efflux RND transporter periplasmic adaptor subunit [Xanthobacteraceae bacterium]|nr:efflux RND transporter periplasmic adaptor subunit [Xanthobacteraceae bacterium]
MVVAGVVMAFATTARVEPVQGDIPAAASKSRQWQAVAPGRVEPRSGQIRVTAAGVSLVDKVLVKANDTVFAGEPLIHFTDTELTARLAAAEVEVAVRKRARDEQPAADKAENRYRASDAAADAERAVYDARAAVDLAAAKRRASGDAQPDAGLTAARAALARARDQLARRQEELHRLETNDLLPDALESELGFARADYTAAWVALDKATIRAPIDGTVLQVYVRAGELSSMASPQPLVLVGDLSALRVRAELDERDLGSIKLGQAVSVRAAAFPGREFEGSVSSIAPLVEPGRLEAGGTHSQSDLDVVEVVVELARPGPLVVGMKADVYFRPESATEMR